jgi:uncharacterized delta-60 repeat protein
MRTRWGQSAVFGAVGIVVFAAPGIAHASGSVLDPTFSSDGKVTTDIGTGDDIANAVVTTPTKIAAVGTAITSHGHDFAIAVYDDAGQLVSGFGNGGIVTTDFGADDVANAAVIQGNKLLVAGTTTTTEGADFALARYNANGSLDSSFGTGGKVVTDVAGDVDGAYAVLAQGDKAVAAGYTLSGTVADFALVRYNADGSPDDTFGTNGRATTDFAGDFDEVRGLVSGPNGGVVAAGYATTNDGSDFALARFDSTGHLDNGFGTGGRTMTSLDGEDVARAITHEGAKLVVAGFTFTGDNGQDFAVARYTADGHLDNTFGGDGSVVTDFAHAADAASGVVVQQGVITVAGSTIIGSAELFGLARYDDQGNLDQTWGTHGQTATQFGSDSARANGLAVQGTKTVAVGFTGSTTGLRFAVARYLAA